MSKPSKVPPRFVPTLTEVVPDAVLPPAQDPLPARQPMSASPPEAPAAPAVEGLGQEAVRMDPRTSDLLNASKLPEGMEEFLVHRVMQRVDVGLDQRLRDAITTVVQEQTRSVLPRLREEIESIVRQVVYEAVADELASVNAGASFKT